MVKRLVIVESPAKAHTIKKILGKNYEVTASYGHIRDLPKTKLGVDIENNFEPSYITIKGKGKVIAELKKKAKKVDQVYLASDPDREGEAIAWHIYNALKLKDKNIRVEFNEITKEAIKNAVKNPKPIDEKKVNSQQTRRILDRIVGYKISPLLWKILSPHASAGRVQSVALKLICDLERKIKAFIPEKFWEVSGIFNKKLKLEIYKIDKKRVKKIKDIKVVEKLKKEIINKEFEVITAKVKKKSKRAPFPLKTSTLQQLASSYLGFTASRTMGIAQSLYEGVSIGGSYVGLITYMRTDSSRISKEAKEAAQEYIKNIFGEKYVGDYVPQKSKGKIQDAHEAVRPTDVNRSPELIKDSLNKDQYKLYKLIWERFLISQFSNMEYEQFELVSEYEKYQFRGTVNRILFDGYYKLFKENDEDSYGGDFPEIKEGDKLLLDKLDITEGITKPPARLTESSLIKKLETDGIGRPSTYAAIIETLKKREYVILTKKSFIPTEFGFEVEEILEKYFPTVMDIKFTAKMEKELDEIEDGNLEWKKVLGDFYGELKEYLEGYNKEISKILNQDIYSDLICKKCGGKMLLKTGRFGKYLECENYEEDKERVSIPKSIKITKEEMELGEIKIADRLSVVVKEKAGIETDVVCKKCGGKMIVKTGRYGKYLECENYAEDKERVSIPKGIELIEEDGIIKIKEQMAKLDAEDEAALKEVGPCDKCGSPMIVKMGRYGKFLACSNYPECKNIKKYPKK
ncbi:DNA topoisomerase 1 [Haliovirga abyssi]|uniref:DNA topoisomerase 1 n=1 Tax=Haliovirga abyssi TaxID=2996794 RepID=A0AAU9DEB0_9FUSO|nr:DNA topoisomerase 1 [Haliovirga abyssi]